MRHRLLHILFDPDDGAGSGGPPAPAGADPPAGPTGSEGSPSPVAAAPAWAGPTEEEWLENQQMLRGVHGALQGLGQQQPAQQYGGYDGGQPSYQLDPFADNFGEQLMHLLWANNQAAVQQIQGLIAPIFAHTEQQINGEAEQRALDMFSDFEARGGEFTKPEGVDLTLTSIARNLADVLYPQAEARYGDGPRAVQAAVDMAAKQVRALENALIAVGVQRTQAQWGKRANLGGEPGGGGAGYQGASDADTELDAARRMMARPTAV